MTGFRYRMLARPSTEMTNLWNWGQQSKGEPGYQQSKGEPGYMGMDLQVFRMENAIREEVERMGGRWTRQDRFAFPTKEQLVHFRMKWG